MIAAITLQSVTKEYASHPVPALTGINLDILTGTRTAILGPSGSGKSTLLIIAGLENPSDGQILLNGRDVTGIVPERRGIGMVFQRPLLFPHLNVLDNVAFPMRAQGSSRRVARDRARPYLALVQLADFASRPVSTLSGGQQQRIAIARTLASQPTILLLDEPFSALDPAFRSDMHELLDRLQSELPPTVVLVTHDRDEAAAVADRIAVVEDGTLLQYDTVDRIYHRPASLAVARLMGGRNTIDGLVTDGVHASDLGLVPIEPGTLSGPGILVVRPESIRVLTDGETTAAPTYSGTVSELARAGARRTLTLRRGAAELVAEIPPGAEIEVGGIARVCFAPGAPSVVPR
ncbi:ABC transporter ATP-binding protein [Microbacterium sp. NPDC078428]|uniref:ABC transporter ATP-binding protein n=1 Tax=Microbacterium sp. NPDC078428 TaxID=3364190 RepID=UPI0037C70CBE